MILLYINDTLADLYPDTVIALNLKSLSIGDLSSRYANRSNNIKLPLTNTNKTIFGNADYLNSASRIPYTTNTVRLIQNGVELINNGSVVINSIDSSINVTIYWGIYGFISAIGDKELKDLTDANADAAVLSNMVMQSGTDPDTTEYFFSLPLSRYKNIVEAIIDETSYAYSGSIFSSNDYLRMVLIYGRDSNEYNENFALEKECYLINSGDSLTPLAGYTKLSFADIQEIGALNMVTSSVWGTDNATDYAFEFTLYCNLNVSVSGGTGAVEFSFLRDGVSVGTPVTVATGASDETSMTYTATHSAGVDYDYSVGYKHSSGSGSTVTVTEATFYVKITRTWLSIVTVGSSDVQNKYMLPDMTQLDFLKEFMKFFGLVPVEKNNEVVFKTIDSIIKDRANAVDWTNKRVKTTDSIEFDSSSYGKNNIFDYTPFDKDIVDGKYEVTIDNINLAEEKAIIKSLFSNSATTYREYTSGVFVNMIDVPSYTGSDIEDAGLRIGMYRSAYSFESTSGLSVAYFKEPREDYDMTWEYFYTNYYATLFGVLGDIKVVEHEYNLTEADIQNFDPSLLIYDNGNYYSFPEIKNYREGRLTKVKMLKI